MVLPYEQVNKEFRKSYYNDRRYSQQYYGRRPSMRTRIPSDSLPYTQRNYNRNSPRAYDHREWSWWDYAMPKRRGLKFGKYAGRSPSRREVTWDAIDSASWLIPIKAGKFPRSKIPRTKIPYSKIPKSRLPNVRTDRLGNVMIPQRYARSRTSRLPTSPRWYHRMRHSQRLRGRSLRNRPYNRGSGAGGSWSRWDIWRMENRPGGYSGNIYDDLARDFPY